MERSGVRREKISALLSSAEWSLGQELWSRSDVMLLKELMLDDDSINAPALDLGSMECWRSFLERRRQLEGKKKFGRWLKQATTKVLEQDCTISYRGKCLSVTEWDSR